MLSQQLRHRVKLQSKSVVQDSYGQETITWTDEAQIWASIEPISGREYFLAKQVQAETTHRIRIRYYSGVRADWRVLYGTRVFNIESVINPEEANKEIILMCREAIT